MLSRVIWHHCDNLLATSKSPSISPAWSSRTRDQRTKRDCKSFSTHRIISSWTEFIYIYIISIFISLYLYLYLSKSLFLIQSIYLYIYGYGSIPIDTFLVGWTSIYQLFWGSLGTRVLTHPHIYIYIYVKSLWWTAEGPEMRQETLWLTLSRLKGEGDWHGTISATPGQTAKNRPGRTPPKKNISINININIYIY
jgi:hypothetical protein